MSRTSRLGTTVIAPTLLGELADGSLDVSRLDETELIILRRHGLVPPLWTLVRSQVAPDSYVYRRMRPWALAEQRRSMRLVAVATSVNSILAEAGVRSLVIKGAPLAVQSVGSWMERSFSDVDVLIASADRARAHEALVAAGYSRRDGQLTAPGRVSDYTRGAAEYESGSVTLDLHWRLDSVRAYFNAPFDDLWDRKLRVKSEGLDVWTVDDTYSLIITAVHGCREFWHRWKWALDALRQISKQPEDSWTEVRARARTVGAERALAVTLAVATQSGLPNVRDATPGPGPQRMARSWLDAGRHGQSLSFTPRKALTRRRDRFGSADTRRAGIDGVQRSVARLAVDAQSGRLRSKFASGRGGSPH